MSGFVPYVVRTEFGDDALFEESKVIYTPETVSFDNRIEPNHIESLSLVSHDDLIGAAPTDVGKMFADAVIMPPSAESSSDMPYFSEDAEAHLEEATAVYDRLLSTVMV